MNKFQLITAALAVGAASVAFADDMTTTTAPADTSMHTCVAKMTKENCDAKHGTMNGTGDDASCVAQMTQADCDAAGGKMDNSTGTDTNNPTTEAPVTQ